MNKQKIKIRLTQIYRMFIRGSHAQLGQFQLGYSITNIFSTTRSYTAFF